MWDQVQRDLGATFRTEGANLDSAVAHLINSGWVTNESGVFHLLPDGANLVNQYERQFTDLIDVFTRQLSVDLNRSFEFDEDQAREIAEIVLDALIDVFELRGRNIMDMLFGERPIDPFGITDLLQPLWNRANTIEEPRSRSALVGFILDILAAPSGVYESVLNYMAKAFFCIQAMRLDPTVSNLVTGIVANRTLLLDENVLIPLTAKHEDRHEFLSSAIDAARSAGMVLCTTQRFVDSVRRHADWASSLVEMRGAQSQDVMNAASGEGDYTPNAFLNGFVNQDPDDTSREFLDYLRDCFCGSYSRESFDSFFPEHLGICILDVPQMANFTQSKVDLRSEAFKLMQEWNRSRPEDNRKSAVRIESEIEAMLIVTDWDSAQLRVEGLEGERVSFVTSGSSVASLARTMQLETQPMMVANAEAIWELLTRLEPSRDENPSFRGMMLSSHFRLAGHFVRSENYRRFFRPLFASARREFEETRDLIEETLNLTIEDDYLEGIEQEDWPRVVSAMRKAVLRQAADQDMQPLVEEIDRLRGIVTDFEEQARKRRRFNRQQKAKKNTPGRKGGRR